MKSLCDNGPENRPPEPAGNEWKTKSNYKTARKNERSARDEYKEFKQ